MEPSASRHVILRDGSRAIGALAAAVVVLAGIYFAQTVLVPLLSAAFITAVTAPLVFFLRRRGVPNGVAMVAGLFVDFVALGVIAVILGVAIAELSGEQERYIARFQEFYAEVTGWLEAKGAHIDFGAVVDTANPRDVVGAVGDLMRRLLGLITQLVLVLLLVAFMLYELETLPKTLEDLFDDHEDLNAIHLALHDVKAFMRVKAGTSIATGLLAGGLCAVMGVDMAILWGLAAFLLNFIPNVGSVIAAIPPIILALFFQGAGSAAILGLGYITINMVIGNVIEPRLLGRALGLSPLVVFISLLVWAALLGPIGALLSPALTVFAKSWFEHTRDLGWLGKLLGPGTPSVEVAPVQAAPVVEAEPVEGTPPVDVVEGAPRDPADDPRE